MLLRKTIGVIRCSFAQMKTATLYNVLGIPSSSTMEEVRNKYIELAKIYHPDVNN